MVNVAIIIMAIVITTGCAIELYLRYFVTEHANERISINEYRNLVYPETDFKSFAANYDEPKNLNLGGCNFFKDFSNKIIKLDNLFRQIHLESITLFEDVKSVKIVPYCIPAVDYTNDEICFKNSEIHSLQNLKLENIVLGRSTIHTKKINRFLYTTHKFDELVISGTTDFVEASSLDKYKTSIFNSNLIIYRDYEKQGFFSLEIPFLEGYSEFKTDRFVVRVIDLHFKRAHDMIFYLPVRGFNGLLDQIENEIDTPTVFFPENITFGCSDFPENDKSVADKISINTENMRLNKQLNYDVINSVQFVKMGDSYYTQFAITFNEIAFTSNMSVQLNNKWVLKEDVLVEINKLHIEVEYYPLRHSMYKVTVSILNGLSLYTEKKMNSYLYTAPFYGKLSSCIKATIVYNVKSSLQFLKDSELELNPKVNYTLWM